MIIHPSIQAMIDYIRAKEAAGSQYGCPGALPRCDLSLDLKELPSSKPSMISPQDGGAAGGQVEVKALDPTDPLEKFQASPELLEFLETFFAWIHERRMAGHTFGNKFENS